ncbi:MAG: hypothetical protein E6Q60_11635 [Nitrosomonas oligotropha]|uniref:Uncharacterized protein n=1 Tax=Nitrosomonas oligotropha TaxID=42354 RepID=A0A5C7VQD1_9PROT|nr:MAG: hypothetical protein E6Q60_11635 [Nitrosomonas oligotropha]
MNTAAQKSFTALEEFELIHSATGSALKYPDNGWIRGYFHQYAVRIKLLSAIETTALPLVSELLYTHLADKDGCCNSLLGKRNILST